MSDERVEMKKVKKGRRRREKSAGFFDACEEGMGWDGLAR